MKWEILKYCVIAGACFGAWPLVMKKSDLGYMMNASILSLITLLIVATQLLTQNKGQISHNFLPIFILFAVIAGILNGYGTGKFINLIASIPKKDIAKAIFTMVIAQLSVTVIGSMIFYHEPFTIKRIAGLITGAITVVLLVM